MTARPTRSKEEQMRRAARRDVTEPEIVGALEQMGFVVDRVSAPGFPDLVVSRGNRFWLCEVKTGKGRLTKAQTYFHARHKAIVPILSCIEDAVAWANKL